jgi:hypothetical protein
MAPKLPKTKEDGSNFIYLLIMRTIHASQ